jgi:hypothetical protein
MLTKAILTTKLNTSHSYIVFIYENKQGGHITKVRNLNQQQVAAWNNYLNEHARAEISFSRWFSFGNDFYWIRTGYTIKH